MALYVKTSLSTLALLSLLVPGSLMAQELPRPSMVHSSETHTLPTDYNMKAGPVYFNVNSSVEADYIDNIGLTEKNTQSDFLLTPEVGITASWPMTKENTLTFATSIGYTKYMIHPEYDTANVLIAPDSQLAFNLFVGNFKINFHDQFSYQQDPVNEGALSNIVNFDRFQNVAGINVLWDMNKLILNFNYDHINFLSTRLQSVSGQDLPDPGALDYTADQVSVSAEAHVSSTLVGGLEATASSRSYDDFSGTYNTVTAGPFVRVQVTQHMKLEASGGYEHSDTPSNTLSPALTAPLGASVLTPGSSSGSFDSYYADVSLDHEVNKYYLQRLSGGHDLQLGLLGDESDVTYVNYTGTWHVNTHLNLALNLSWQDVSELGGLVSVSSYNMLGAGFQASFPVTRSISGALIYQFTDKLANTSSEGYLQDRLGLILTYHF
jgi:hypothetical protein